MCNLILPICGQSTRYGLNQPKWSLKHNNEYMLEKSIKGLNLSCFDNIVVIMLKEHEKFLDRKFNFPHTIKYLETPTQHQPETVYLGTLDLDGQIVIKDCDNYFKVDVLYDNFIAYYDIREHKLNASNKSYIEINENQQTINIVEKEVISNFFCCGLYSFKDIKEFRENYKICKKLNPELPLYISDIIYSMIIKNKIFYGIKATNYIDWGTIEDWLIYRNNHDI